MSRSALLFFAKVIFGRTSGKLGALVSVCYGILGGAMLPLLAAELIRTIGTPHLISAVRLLVLCWLCVMVLEIAQRHFFDVAAMQSRKVLADVCAEKLEKVPLDADQAESFRTKLNRFFSSHKSAAHMFVSEFPAVFVGLTGFVIILIVRGVPWQVYVTVAVFLTMPAVAYHILKRQSSFAEALLKEGEEIEALALIGDSRKDPWALPALQAHRKKVSRDVIATRRQSDRTVIIHVITKAALKAMIGITAVLAMSSVSLEVAALLVVFSLTFAGHLSSLYYFAEFFHKVSLEGAPLLELLSVPAKPPLPPLVRQGEEIQMSGLSVTYPGGKTVIIKDKRFDPLATIVYDQPNGAGKTTGARLSAGLLGGYEGSLKFWGCEIKEYNPAGRIILFDQTRLPKPVSIKALFEGHGQGVIGQHLMYPILKSVGADDLDLSVKHNELSEGQRQKIDLALVMFYALTDQKVQRVIFDEPTNHIDTQSIGMVWEGINAFIKTFFGGVEIISHDPRLFLEGEVLRVDEVVEAIPA